jgi:hypothetical protein
MSTFGPTSIVSKEVSLSVGTIGTFLGNLEDLFWQNNGELD